MDSDGTDMNPSRLKPSERVLQYGEKVEEIRNEYITWFQFREFPFSICWLVSREFPYAWYNNGKFSKCNTLSVEGFFHSIKAGEDCSNTQSLIDVLDYMHTIRYQLYYDDALVPVDTQHVRYIRAKRRRAVRDRCEQSYHQFDQMTSFIRTGRPIYAYIVVKQVGTEQPPGIQWIPPHPYAEKFSHTFRRFCWDTVLPLPIENITRLGEPCGLFVQDCWGATNSCYGTADDARITFTVQLRKDHFTHAQQNTLDLFWQHISAITPSSWDSYCKICKRPVRQNLYHRLHRRSSIFSCTTCLVKSLTNDDNDKDDSVQDSPVVPVNVTSAKPVDHGVDGIGIPVNFDQGVMNVGSMGFQISFDRRYDDPNYHADLDECDAQLWVQFLIASSQRFYQIMDLVRASFLSPPVSIKHGRNPVASVSSTKKRKNNVRNTHDHNYHMNEFSEWISVVEIWKEVFEYEIEISDTCVPHTQSHRLLYIREFDEKPRIYAL